MAGSVYSNGATASISLSLANTWDFVGWHKSIAASFTTGAGYQYFCRLLSWAYAVEIYSQLSSGEHRIYSGPIGEIAFSTGSSTTWKGVRVVKDGTDMLAQVLNSGGTAWTTIAAWSVTDAELLEVKFFEDAQGKYARSCNLFTVEHTEAEDLLEIHSRTVVDTAHCWGAWFGGETPAANGNDLSGNAHHLSVTGSLATSGDDPIVDSGLSSTLFAFTTRVDAGLLSTAAAATAASRRAKWYFPRFATGLATTVATAAQRSDATTETTTLGTSQPTRRAVADQAATTSAFGGPTIGASTQRTDAGPMATGLGSASPSGTTRNRRAAISTGIATTHQARDVRFDVAATSTAFGASQQTRSLRARWTAIAASADAITSAFTTTVRQRFAALASAFAGATQSTRADRRRSPGGSTALGAAVGSATQRGDQTSLNTAQSATVASSTLRQDSTAQMSAAAATQQTRTTRSRWATIAGSADAYFAQFTATMRQRFGATSTSFAGATQQTRQQKLRWSALSTAAGALVSTLHSATARLRFGASSTSLSASHSTSKSRRAFVAVASAFAGAVQATHRTIRRFGAVVTGQPITHRKFPARLGQMRARSVALGKGRARGVSLK